MEPVLTSVPVEMLKRVLVLCALSAAAVAFLERASLEPKPEKYADKEGCYVSAEDTVVPFNEVLLGGAGRRCVEYRCHEDGVTIAGCSVITITEGCKQVEDQTLAYPDCCPKQAC